MTSIGDSAFQSCSSLTNVDNLSNVTILGAQAFLGCSALESVGDLSSVTSIGNFAFLYCNNLTLRVLPNSYAEQYAKDNNINYTYIVD